MADHMDDLAMRLEGELGKLEQQERAVLQSMKTGAFVSRDPTAISDRSDKLGERLSDRVAQVGGSWSFIIAFALVLFGWMLLNTEVLSHWGMAFDPYPYIFLNLMLSTLAAIQAPIIMMSQNRQAAKDRLTTKLDYQVNLRAELEILRLHRTIETDVVAVVARLESKLDAMSPTPNQGERSTPTAT